MNIKDYYTGMTRLYINQTVLFTVVFAAIILPSLVKIHFLPANLAGMFVFLCIIYFFLMYLYFSNVSRGLDSLLGLKNYGTGNAEPYLLIQSSPSNTLLDLYSFDGIRRISLSKVKGKERRARHKLTSKPYPKSIFSVRDQGANKISHIHMNPKHSYIFIDEKKFPVIINKIRYGEREIIIGSTRYHLKKTYSDYILSRHGKVVMTIKKGIMPVKMQNYYHPNTPLLEFQGRLLADEKHLCICLVVFF